jgi:hypothetical protein
VARYIVHLPPVYRSPSLPLPQSPLRDKTLEQQRQRQRQRSLPRPPFFFLSSLPFKYLLSRLPPFLCTKPTATAPFLRCGPQPTNRPTDRSPTSPLPCNRASWMPSQTTSNHIHHRYTLSCSPLSRSHLPQLTNLPTTPWLRHYPPIHIRP